MTKNLSQKYMFQIKQTLIAFGLFVAILGGAAQSISAQINIGGFKIPKIKHPDTKQTSGQTSGGNTGGNTSGQKSDQPQEVQTNPNAPAEYNANLNPGDQAIAIDNFRDGEAVKILAKSGTAYKVAKLKDPDSVRWYSLNSVYPYFDKQGFEELIFDYKRYLSPYLPCYAKKHNLDQGRVTDNGYMGSNFSNAEEAQKELQAVQPKLAELDNLIKTKVGSTPDIFLPYAENPAIAAEIASQRGEYLKCVVGEEDSKPDFRLGIFLDDIKKAQEEVDRYTPADFLYLVSAGDSSEELLRAISKREREEWAKQWLKNPNSRAEFDAAWDRLAAAASKKIPQYKPDVSRFKFHYPAGEKLLTDSLKTRPGLKVFRIGTDTAGWDIQKDSSNFPSYRYKDVNIYFRDPAGDDPFCRVVTARVKQDYAGGGTYSANIYRSSTSEEIYGCP